MRVAVGLMVGLLAGWLSPARAAAGLEDVLGAGLDDLAKGRGAVDRQEARRAFLQAADRFDHADRQGVHSPGLYLNLGNAQFLSDRLPEAIYAYRRGLRLEPEHRLLQTNLDYARQKVVAPPGLVLPLSSAPEWWRPLTRWIRTLALACYLLAIPTLFCWGVTCRRSAGLAALALILLCAGSNYFAGRLDKIQGQYDLDYPLVVIREDKLPLRKGTGPSYAYHANVPLLPAGLEARRLLERGGWLQIEIPGGAIGWVPREAVLVDDEQTRTQAPG